MENEATTPEESVDVAQKTEQDVIKQIAQILEENNYKLDIQQTIVIEKKE